MRISDWSSDCCSSDLESGCMDLARIGEGLAIGVVDRRVAHADVHADARNHEQQCTDGAGGDFVAIDDEGNVAAAIGATGNFCTYAVAARCEGCGGREQRVLVAGVVIEMQFSVLDVEDEARSEGRRVGNECVSTWRSRW